MSHAAEALLNDIHNIGLDDEIKFSDIHAELADFNEAELMILKSKLKKITILVNKHLTRNNL